MYILPIDLLVPLWWVSATSCRLFLAAALLLLPSSAPVRPTSGQRTRVVGWVVVSVCSSPTFGRGVPVVGGEEAAT